MLLLRTTVRHYAWGRPDGMAELVGTVPSGGPEAELWVGAHPGAPSMVVDDAEGRSLAEVIASDPRRWLGADLVDRGVTTLPFLLKVLAIGEPLSLQAHPSAAQARVGFAREEAAGIPFDAPERTYKDPNAKPESLVALRETWALCGFRPPSEGAGLVDALAVHGLEPLGKILRAGAPTALVDALGWILHLEDPERTAVARAVAEAAGARAGLGDGTDAFGWVSALSRLHPDDPTILAPVLLNVVRLAPGDAVHLPAGNLHAYLRGAGIEVMAASDNVLRGGLTPKHVDVDELLAVLRAEPGLPEPPVAQVVAPGLTTFDSGEDSYGLALVDARRRPVEIDPTAPSLLLATGGEVQVAGPAGHHRLHGDAALFVPPGAGPLSVSGAGRLWWATVGPALPT